MRVLYVIDSLTPGGTETSTVALAGELVSLGHEVTIAVLRSESHSLAEVAIGAGVDVREVPASSFIRQVLFLRRVLREIDPTVVHTSLFRADQVGRLAAAGPQTPVVSSFVSTPYDPVRFADPTLRAWKLRLVQLCDALTAHLLVRRFHAVSAGAASENARALRLAPSKVRVVHRGRDEAMFAAPTDERLVRLRSELGLEPDSRIVINIGRLDRLKGQLRLINAVELLLDEMPTLQLLIAGKPGSASHEIEDHLRQHPATSQHVRLLGHRDDIGDLLHLAEVLAVSSTVEGTAGAAIEAMATGTPVVSTRVAGAVGILEDGHNAVLVDHSSEAIASGILRVLEAPAAFQPMAANGRADFLERFTLRSAATELLEFYSEVAESPSAAHRPSLPRPHRS